MKKEIIKYSLVSNTLENQPFVYYCVGTYHYVNPLYFEKFKEHIERIASKYGEEWELQEVEAEDSKTMQLITLSGEFILSV